MKKILVSVFLLLFYSLGLVKAQEFYSDNFVVSQFGLKAGLPQSSVNDIIQTEDGYIWLATYGGLVRFDGLSFTTFNRSNSEGMGSDRIMHLHEDKEGTIWLSTETGFTTFKGGKFKSFELQDVGAINAPQQIVQDNEGRTWGLVDGLPYYFEKDRMSKREVFKDEDLVKRSLSNKEGVFIAYHKTIFHTLSDSVVLIKDFESVLESEIIGIKEFPKNSGIVYIATARDGVYRYKNDQLVSYKTSEGFSSNFIKKLSVDRDSTFWVTTYNGVSRFNGKQFEIFEPIKVDYELNYTSIFKDNEDNYWIGTLGDGLFSVKSSIIKTIGKEEGIENDIMLSLIELKDGRKLFSTNCGGIYEWNQGKLIYSLLNKHLPNLCVWSIFQDSNNRIWFGAEELYRIESPDLAVTGKVIDDKDGFNGHAIQSIMEDTKGNIWIGALDGLFKFDEFEFKHFTTDEGLSSNNVRVIYEDNSEVLWIGTISGLDKIENGKITSVSLQPESGKKLEKEPYVRAVFEYKKEEFWVGSYGNGLFRIKEGKVCNITANDGLYDNIVSHLVKDERDNFWMGSNRGIFRLSIASAEAFCDGKLENVQSFSYGEQDGMISVETNGGFQPSVIQDSLDNIYFPTVGGVAVVATQKADVNNVAPLVYIEKISNSEKDTTFIEAITLPYNDAFLEINYTAINFKDPEKVEFKYRLKGLNDTWINVGNRREALFSKIPPGKYAFQVIANNGDGVWNMEGASFSITVTPPFWQRIWFYCLSVVLVIVLAGAFYYQRIREFRKENERQKRFTEKLIDSQENERRRIASELHDGLGQQILVIKNRAELAQNSLDDLDSLSKQLEEISESAFISISDVRSISHNLRPVHLENFGITEALNNLCNQFQQTSTIELSYHIDDIDKRIGREKEIHFYRVIQEAMNNIIKHSNAQEASVLVRVVNNVITTKLWDDGKGFDVKIIDGMSGLGFLGMKERIETLGGKFDVKSSAHTGTLVKVLIPIQPNG